MSDFLHVAGIQTYLKWESIEKNLRSLEIKISELSRDVDLIVLPEMFSTGFTMDPSSVAERMDGKGVLWMKQMAEKTNSAIVGSLVIEEGEKYFNRCVFVYPDGNIVTYDKRHSFTLAGEDKEYTSGNQKLIVAYKGWKICPLICYDLRFPVWSRNVEDYDVLIYMANWPKPRITAWDTLLSARAIENMVYTIGVNRIGEDENQYIYSGHSTILDCLGNVVSVLSENEDGIIAAKLDKPYQNSIRRKLNFLQDKDQFTIQDS